MRLWLEIYIILSYFSITTQSQFIVHDVSITPPSINQNGSVSLGQPIPDWSDAKLDGKIRFIEVLLAVDAATARYYGQDMAKIQGAMITMIHSVNMYLFQLDLRILISDIRLVRGYNLTLDQFSKWRADQEDLPQHDMAMLMRFRYEGGIAYVNGMCKRNGVGIAGFFPEAPFEYATVFVHELSHLLGMTHDQKGECYCETRKGGCLQIDGFEHDCSVQSLVDLLPQHECIQEAPIMVSTTYVAVCGNGVLEEAEECDCGPAKFCQNLLCDPRSCTYLFPRQILYGAAILLCIVLAILILCFVRSTCIAIRRIVCLRKKNSSPPATPQRCLVSTESSPDIPTPLSKTTSNKSTETLLPDCAILPTFYETPRRVVERKPIRLDMPLPLHTEDKSPEYMKMSAPSSTIPSESMTGNVKEIKKTDISRPKYPPPPPKKHRLDYSSLTMKDIVYPSVSDKGPKPQSSTLIRARPHISDPIPMIVKSEKIKETPIYDVPNVKVVHPTRIAPPPPKREDENTLTVTEDSEEEKRNVVEQEEKIYCIPPSIQNNKVASVEQYYKL